MHDLTGVQEVERVDDRVALHLELTGVERDAARCLRPYADCVVDVVRAEAGLLNLLNRQTLRELMDDRAHHLQVGEFLGADVGIENCTSEK